MTVCIIGLGYVGLTLATVLAESGLSVSGVEIRRELVDLINSGKPHFLEIGLEKSLSKVVQNGYFAAFTEIPSHISFDVYIITVGTPLDENGIARTDMIKRSAEEVSSHMRDGSLIILRSTVKVGTTNDIVFPILQKSNKKLFLAMCPERTLEGRALKELRELPQIVGGIDSASTEMAIKLFSKITNTVVRVSDCKTAEMIKLADNTYRDVQFAFANEIARACEALNINANEVINSGKLGYSRTNIPSPGLVGGPCLEKDPHILNQSVSNKGIDLEITKACRLVNERQPLETFKFILSEYYLRFTETNPKIAILGMAFKGNPATDDLRGSMAIKILTLVKQYLPYAQVHIFDSVISAEVLKSNFPNCIINDDVFNTVSNSAVTIFANNHEFFSTLDLFSLQRIIRARGFIYDYWNQFGTIDTTPDEKFYFSIGNIK